MVDKVLVVDDEPEILRFLGEFLGRNGYEVFQARDGVAGLKELFAHQPDLVLVDIMMPLMDGYTLCRRIREVSNVPIIMVSGVSQDVSKVEALKIGADDYVTKPFSITELAARIGAALRRSRLPPPTSLKRYSDAILDLDFQKREVMVRGQLLSLTPSEFNLLTVLVQNGDKVLTWQQLFDALELQGKDAYDVLKWHVFTLRRKLENAPSHSQCIISVRGVGYRYAQPSE